MESTKNYHDDIIIQIKELIAQSKFEEAYRILKEELNAPYVPSDKKEQFSELFRIVNHEMYLKTTSKKDFSLISIDAVRRMLNQEKSTDLECHILYNLKDVNLRLLMPEIKSFLVNPNKDNILKTVIIEAMHSQSIDNNFKIIKNGVEYVINPTSIIPIFLTSQYKDTVDVLKNYLGIHWLNIFQMNLLILEWFAYYTYPVLFDERDCSCVACAVAFYCFKINKQIMDLDQLVELFQVDKTKTLDYINKIESIWEN